MKIIPFEAAHLTEIIADNPDAQMAKVFFDRLDPSVLIANAYTAMDGERLLAAGGIIDCGKGYGVGWYIGDCKGHALWLGKTMRYLMAERVKILNLQVLEIKLLQNFKEACRLAEFLGFTIRESFYLATREF